MSSHVELPSDPEKRRKLQALIKDCVLVKEKVQSLESSISETVKSAEKEFHIPKKFINKLITTAYKCNFEQMQVENESFEHMYESLMQGVDKNNV